MNGKSEMKVVKVEKIFALIAFSLKRTENVLFTFFNMQ